MSASSTGRGVMKSSLDPRRSATTVREIVDLIPLADDAFLAPPLDFAGSQPLFGGQLFAQALRAANHTVPSDHIGQSVHGYFMQPANPREPLKYSVRRVGNGRRYSWRHVSATQGGVLISCLSCVFSRPKPGVEFQAVDMPAVPPPSALRSYPLDTLQTRDASRLFDLEARFLEDPEPWIGGPARMWLRVREPLGDDLSAQACGVAFLSDMSNGLSGVPQARPDSRLMSLDHTVWLHRSCRADDWLLMDLKPHTTSSGRGLYSGHMFDQGGQLVATLAQECLFDNTATDSP